MKDNKIQLKKSIKGYQFINGQHWIVVVVIMIITMIL